MSAGGGRHGSDRFGTRGSGSHRRVRKVFVLANVAKTPLALEAVRRIDVLFALAAAGGVGCLARTEFRCCRGFGASCAGRQSLSRMQYDQRLRAVCGLARLGPIRLAAGPALAGIGIAVGKGVEDAAKADQSFRRREAVLKATGYASGLTAKEIAAFPCARCAAVRPSRWRAIGYARSCQQHFVTQLQIRSSKPLL